MFGCGGSTKRAAAFAVAGRHVNPVIIEEILGDVIKFGRKFPVGVEHNFDAFVPGIFGIVAERQRRVAVPVLDFVDAQPFGFQLVKTVGDVFVVFAHRLRQNVNGRILDVFGQVAFGNRTFETAFFVLNRLVFDDHVVNHGKQRRILFADAVDFLAGLFTNLRVFVQQQLADFSVVVLPAVNRKDQARRGFFIQAYPSRTGSDGLFVQNLFNRFGQFIFFETPNLVQPGLIESNPFILKPFFDFGIGKPVDFQTEKNGRFAVIGQFFADVLIKGHRVFVLHLRNHVQIGKLAEHAPQNRHFLFGFERGQKFRGSQAGQLAFIFFGKRKRVFSEFFQIGADFRIVNALIHVGQIPGGKFIVVFAAHVPLFPFLHFP